MSEGHVVFVMMPSTGHVNPSLPIVVELKSRGVIVTYYVHEQFREVVEATGANWRQMQRPHDLTDEQATKYLHGLEKTACLFPASAVPVAAAILPSLLSDMESLHPRPSLILYDPLLPQGLVVAQQLRIPSVSLLTFTGPGVVSSQASLETNPVVQRAAQEIKEVYGIDIFAHGTIGEFYSMDRNTVATLERLFAPPTSSFQKERLSKVPFRCVGPLIASEESRVSHAWASAEQLDKKLPWKTIDEARQGSKKVIYVSMGSVATSSFWARKFGPTAESNGLQAFSGKEFVQFVLKAAFEAFGHEEDILVVAAIGPQFDALEGLPPAPENFILQEVVPQLQLLQKCDVFITHGGANSLHEAIALAVPLVIVPMFHDQPFNADALVDTGAAASFKFPSETLSPTALRSAVRQMLEPENSFRLAAGKLSQQMARSGGIARAVDFILFGDAADVHG
mmetsp:Transcript_2315/g.4831  ORF Transcript_2315/g.4831 Transcript_2315/m.4831 type:complete len:452 (+) Transcript_2315:45-1400(+)